jgi:DNA-binding PadR family transcriptional regulator
MHNEKPNKKLQSVLTPLIYLLYHKEASVEEIARQTEKNYSTILRVISQLSKSEFVKFRLERTAPRGKELRFYTITFDGLAFYYQWRHMLEHSVSEMRKVAKVHEDMLLVFKKWDKFALANCEEDMFTRVVSALNSTQRERHNIIGISEIGLHFLKDDESMRRNFVDSLVLGFYHMHHPVKYVNEEVGEKAWGWLEDIWKVVECDYELRKKRDEYLDRLEREDREGLKAIAEWRKYLKIKQPTKP